MHFVRIVALLAVALTVHNIEEVLWLPAWASRHGFWPAKDGTIRFRGALLVLTFAVLFLAGMSARTGPRSPWTLFMLGTAAVVWANVFIPHLTLSLKTHSIMPGTATGVFFCLPVSSLLLASALREGVVRIGSLVACAAAIAILVFGLVRWLLGPIRLPRAR